MRTPRIKRCTFVLVTQFWMLLYFQGAYSFEYFPLKVATTQGKLEFNCSELGLYIFDIELRAIPTGPEKALHFNVCLGNSQSLTARFINYSKNKTDYICKVSQYYCTAR